MAIAAILPRYRIQIERGARLDWRFAGTTLPKGPVRVRLKEQDRVVMAQSAAGSIFDLVEVPSAT
jgi:hypothetical protein